MNTRKYNDGGDYFFDEEILFVGYARVRRGGIAAHQYAPSFALHRRHVHDGDVQVDADHVVAREPGEHEEP